MVNNKKAQSGDIILVLIILVIALVGITGWSVSNSTDLTYDLSVVGTDIDYDDYVEYNSTDKSLLFKPYNVTNTTFTIDNLSFEDNFEEDTSVNLSDVSNFKLIYTLQVDAPNENSTIDVVLSHPNSTFRIDVLNIFSANESTIFANINGTSTSSVEFDTLEDVVVELDYNNVTDVAYVKIYVDDLLQETRLFSVADDLQGVTGLDNFEFQIDRVGTDAVVKIKSIEAKIYE